MSLSLVAIDKLVVGLVLAIVVGGVVILVILVVGVVALGRGFVLAEDS